jgi:TonB-dependent receptor
VYDTAGKPFDVIVTGPTNGADGHARGVEIAYQQYFDGLPGWMSGFGLQANYTYVDSKMKRKNNVSQAYCSAGAGADNLNLFINGCDTDGRTFGDSPLPNLSRNTFNLALLYDKGPISARIAYSWRGRYLYGVALNSDNTGPNQQNGLDTNKASATYGANNLPIGLPLWADNYGQLDAGIQYKWNDQLTLNLQAQNLTDAYYKQLMQQHTGMNEHSYFTSGRRYTLSMQYSF